MRAEESYYLGAYQGRPLRKVVAEVAFVILGYAIFLVLALLTWEAVLEHGGVEFCSVQGAGPGQQTCAWISAAVYLVPLLPAVLLARSCAGPKPLGRLFSVDGRIKLAKLGKYTTIALLIYVPLYFIQLGMAGFGGRSLTSVAEEICASYLIAGAVVLVQSVAEEVFFRGFIPQVIGRFISNDWVCVATSSLLFTLGHLESVQTAIVSLVFGVGLAYVCLRTCGIEAAFALHIVNNLTIYGVEAVLWGTQVQLGELGVFVLSIACPLLYFLVVTAKHDSNTSSSTEQLLH